MRAILSGFLFLSCSLFWSTSLLAQGGIEASLLQGLSAEDRQRALRAVQGGSGREQSDTEVTGDDPADRALRTARGTDRERLAAARGENADPERDTRDPVTGLPLFGYELFDPRLAQNPTASHLPAPAEYVLGPGDVVRVQLFGNQNETLNLAVTRDGVVNFPKLGPIQVAGLRLDEARQVIERRVAKEMIGVQTNITLGPLRGMQVFLLGDVRRAGAYAVSGQATISQVLLAGGGISPAGSLRNVQLKRGGRVVGSLDLYDFLLRGDASGDLRLQAGDAVFVPPVGGRVAVAGAVRRPAIYELKGSLRLDRALDLAGGLSGEARRGQLLLERVNADGQRSLRALDLAAATSLTLELRDGDRLYAPPVSGQIDNRVSVSGHVRYPNNYAWSVEMTLSRLLGLAQVRPSQPGLELYPLLGLIERSNPQSGLREWSGFDLAAVMAGRSDQPLQAQDRVLILSREHTDYLAAPEVAAALRGELPEPAATPWAVQRAGLTPDTNEAAGAERFASSTEWRREPRPEPRLTEELLTVVPPARSRDALDQQATEICPALPEVARIAGSARALAIRMVLSAQERRPESDGLAARSPDQPADRQLGVAALGNARLEAAGSAAQGANPLLEAPDRRFERRVAPPTECPQLFHEAPTALVYLLERGVGLIGEVRRPGLYPVPEQIDYRRLLEAAGGLTAEADAERVDLFTAAGARSGSGARFVSVELAANTPTPVARPGEIFQVRPGLSLPEVGAVTLRGEVRFPGRYLISRGERLTDLLVRAGGLSETAYPYGAVFTRESARRAESESNRRAANDLREALATATTKGVLNQAQGQSSAFLSDLLLRLETTPPVGRIVIEADPALLAGRPEDNLLLEPGDELYIPKRPSAVTVTGQVLNPGTLAFRSNARAEDYLKQAGGFSKSADDERLFLVLPDGSARPLSSSFWNYRSEAIPPGSVIVVPRDAAPLTGLLLTERIASIVSNLALSAAALVTISD